MTVDKPATPIIHSLEAIGSQYRAWLVDIWGVMHNGHRAFPDAVAATSAFREQGGIVVLVSNSPRPTPGVQEQLRNLSVPDTAYDATVTSGDLTRYELIQYAGARVFHIGPKRDQVIFADLDLSLVEPEDAELIVCSNLFNDENETPDDYKSLLDNLASAEVPMVCANPDHKVERGNSLVYCAGALAALYERAGGAVVYAGKPHAPIYRLALKTICSLTGRDVGMNEVLAIGDGITTDIAGASNVGIDAVFVASGVHVQSSNNRDVDDLMMDELFAEGNYRPVAAMNSLAW